MDHYVEQQSHGLPACRNGAEARREDRIAVHAVLPGTIQVPPNGQPIVLMGDAQSTGGYPKIGAIIKADLWMLAQVRLNDGMRFNQWKKRGTCSRKSASM